MKGVKNRVVLAAGGTGGHVFPAQAVAAELLSKGVEVFIFTDGRGTQFKDEAITFLTIPAAHITGGGVIKKLKALVMLFLGASKAFYLLLRLRPKVVVGFGGYASFPTLLVAELLRFHTIVHQADAYLGRANRLLSFFVTTLATSFPQVNNIPESCNQKVEFTGLPIRQDIRFSPYIPPQKKGVIRLLVTGGSQGAKVFSEVLPQAIALLSPAMQERLFISQQCREEFLERTHDLYKKTRATVELLPFLDQMGKRYKAAHLFLGRAGASSVMETACAGRPGIFVPYPYAMDDHQFYNAQAVVQCGGGWMMREKEFTPEALANFLVDFITFPWKLQDAAVNIQKIAIPDAALRLANLIEPTRI